MELTIGELDSLHDIDYTLGGARTLLFGLASCDEIDMDMSAALNIVADIIETDRNKLQRILRDRGQTEKAQRGE